MAYVQVDWEYGSVTQIVGFRIYTQGQLRGDVGRDERIFYDDVDDLIGVHYRTTYHVVAYDEFGRESAECALSDVELTAPATPKMVSQSEPSGEALAFVEYGPGNPGEGYKYFDQTNGRLDWSHNSGGINGPFKYVLTYEFLTPTTVVRWGWLERIYYISAGPDERYYNPFELYGIQPSGDEVLLSAIEANQDYPSGTTRTADLDSIEAYSTYKIVFSGEWIGASYSYIAKLSEVYLYAVPPTT